MNIYNEICELEYDILDPLYDLIYENHLKYDKNYHGYFYNIYDDYIEVTIYNNVHNNIGICFYKRNKIGLIIYRSDYLSKDINKKDIHAYITYIKRKSIIDSL